MKKNTAKNADAKSGNKEEARVDFAGIEKKWQKEWEKARVFEANPDKRKKFFIFRLTLVQ